MKIVNIFHRIASFFKSIFLSGLFTILPIAFTLFFINFTYSFVYKILLPLREVEPLFLQRIPGSEFVIATVLILLLGFILKVFIMHSVVHYFERLINKIPLIRIIYSSAKMLVDFFKVSKKQSSSREVVLIAYPREGNYHLAFLLESAVDSYQKIVPASEQHRKYCKVFMPTSPNPTTGYFFILPEDEVIRTNITFEEAVKTLMSCGLITPESLILMDQQPQEHKTP